VLKMLSQCFWNYLVIPTSDTYLEAEYYTCKLCVFFFYKFLWAISLKCIAPQALTFFSKYESFVGLNKNNCSDFLLHLEVRILLLLSFLCLEVMIQPKGMKCGLPISFNLYLILHCKVSLQWL
jgi:hypothetical protein